MTTRNLDDDALAVLLRAIDDIKKLLEDETDEEREEREAREAEERFEAAGSDLHEHPFDGSAEINPCTERRKSCWNPGTEWEGPSNY